MTFLTTILVNSATMFWLIIGAICVIIIVLCVFWVYIEKKTKSLLGLGFAYVDYYMDNCGKISYYRTAGNYFENTYRTNYSTINQNKNKWYILGTKRNEINNLIDFYTQAKELTKQLQQLFSLTHYFAYSEYKTYEREIRLLDTAMTNFLERSDFQEYLREKYGSDMTKAKGWIVQKNHSHNMPALRSTHNKEFVASELRKHQYFFDTVLNYPLDQQQRESIVKLEDNCLVISSAGSGKTSTSIAKVKYLLERRHLSKEEILVLSYNRKTAEEFQERLNVPGLTCKTFHALALSIIGQTEGKRPDISEDTLLLECYYKLVRQNVEFKAAINKFFGELSSLTKTEFEYDNATLYHEDRAKYGIMAPYGDMNGNPIYTRSEEEKRICTWLSTHGIRFRYEQPYPVDTANEDYRRYKPDFTIYFNRDGRTYYVFLEHFGIDANGNVPSWFAEGHRSYDEVNNRYNSDIRWKRDLHQKNHTVLLETTSSMFHNGTIWQQLEQQLRSNNIIPQELTEDEKYRLLIERNESMESNIMTLFSSFINLMKSNGETFDGIMKAIEKDNQPEDFCNRSRYLMFNLIKPLYEEYQRTLKEKGQMDFTDLILHAAELCNSGKYASPYSYILVDEFQDISVDRYKLLLSLRKKEPLTKTFCVGDDWQSIYRFSGSDMNLFNDFERYFGFTEKCKIETTYRFGNPLVEKSSKFILKNPAQVSKDVKPFADTTTTDIKFVSFTRDAATSYLDKITEVLNSIPPEETVMLIARYNYEVNVFPKNCIHSTPNSKRATVTYANRTMDFMSVHAAKGLEADNVIILNCSQDKGGFPSRVSDDPILGYVLSEIDTYEYSEERRLFYVAITRAKKHTYVLYNENVPSVFVTEMLEEDEEHEQMLCPLCKRGRLRLVKEGVTKNGKDYRCYNCSNTVAGCTYFWIVYHDSEGDFDDDVQQQYQALANRPPQPKSASLINTNLPGSVTPRHPGADTNPWRPTPPAPTPNNPPRVDLPF